MTKPKKKRKIEEVSGIFKMSKKLSVLLEEIKYFRNNASIQKANMSA